MRKLRVAAVAAAFAGLGLFAVGCGPTNTSSTDSSKIQKEIDKSKEQQEKRKDELKEGADKVKEGVKEGLDAVVKEGKDLADKANKEVEGFTAALKNVDEEIKKGGDAKKLGDLQAVKTDGEKMLADLKKKITEGIAALKDKASFDTLKGEVMKLIDDLKKKLEPFMKKA
jgi:uncharacterized phage infection (PIP) family protein YhgE